ncbi:transcriptional regulator, PadR-like family [Pseudovibrio sp. FO-BEG1]|uniref:PadR family transcriptional regulator n=1 Tax=Pseudovibrio sp. (strain FO-BEG1) TaxID=911045 RepID=UPI000238D14A|nr:PadR family transcriptional regulator [Pseudovibrio sp. FO-BEG1]AEV34538.1 transcriptional regulator, PadR-like family [Pseudovibrio sp. FO-BEG1]
MSESLTDSELLVLGLVSEMPRHGYELEQIIEQRGMREWTQIGFSSIYFVLGKLEKKGLITAEKPAGTKAKKSYLMTEAGQQALIIQTLSALTTVRPTYSSLLMGMIHWPALQREQALDALSQRGKAIQEEIIRIEGIQLDQQPLPDHVDALFDYSIAQLKSEADWLQKTLDYMTCKPWNT